MRTLQDVFDEFKLTSEGQEAMCHFGNILFMYKKWGSVLETWNILVCENATDSIKNEIYRIYNEKFSEWSAQHTLFIGDLNKSIDLLLIDDIQGYKYFNKLDWNINYNNGDINVAYIPTGAKSGWCESMKNILMK